MRVENALSLGEVVLVPEMNFLIDIVLHLGGEEKFLPMIENLMGNMSW